MLGALIMIFVGFRAKQFKWWHAALILFLAGFAVNLSANRLTAQGFATDLEWVSMLMFQQTLITAVAYAVGIWLGIAWATRKAMKLGSVSNDEL